MNDLDYLKLSKPQKLVHKVKEFFVSLPHRLLEALKNLLLWIVNLFKKIGLGIWDLVKTYIRGDWKTKISYTIMGFGSMARGQWMRGILFFVFQTVFNWYMYAMGLNFIKKLITLGTVETLTVNRKTVYGDNSFLILLYGVLTLFFVLAFIYTWYANIKQNKVSEQLLKAGKKLKTAKDDMSSMLDSQFHKTLLALPTLGVTIFTILPIVFMILVAFTNYDGQHVPPSKLFSWVGMENFQTLLSTQETPVTIAQSSKGVDTITLQINASDGDTLYIDTADMAAAETAIGMTQRPSAKLTFEEATFEYPNEFIEEPHTFGLVATRLDEIKFKTDALLYSEPGLNVLSFINGNLKVSLSDHTASPFYITLQNDAGQYVMFRIDSSEYAVRIYNRSTIKNATLTLFDSLNAQFTMADTPAHITHQLIAQTDSRKFTINGAGYVASSSAITMDDLAAQSPVISLEKDGQGNDLLQFTAASGDYIAFRPDDVALAQALVDQADSEIQLSLTAFNKHRFTVDKDGASMRVDGYELIASGNGVTLDSMKQRENTVLTVSAQEDANGVALVTITADNGDYVTLKTHQADKVLDIAEHAKLPEAEPAAESTEEAPLPVVTLTMAALPSCYDFEVYSILGDPVSFTGTNLKVSQPTSSFSGTFRHVLLWTLVWAFFATFLNYFLGMLVAIMINKKGIKLKKLWRTVLVMTIAIPQFISLLYVSKMFAPDGIINGMLQNWHLIKEPLPFWTNGTWARITIIVINIWIGVPYLMLIATGILMNIPADLYESARIDGANAFQMYRKITLPYMLFVTGPYLLTSFTGNINNFNVIYLLSQGKPTSMGLHANAGSTDLLITWLYDMTVTDHNYKLAAVIGILVFIVCAVINLIVYNLIPSVKNEEDFQ